MLLPLDVIHVASASGLHWDDGMSTLIEQDYSVLECKDEATGLLPFMTFASSISDGQNRADLNTLFDMIKKYPQSVQFCNSPKKRRVMKKRDNEEVITDISSSIGTKLRKLN